MSGTTGCGSAEFRSGPKISGTTLSKVIRFCSTACRTGVLYFGTGTEVVPGNPVVIPPAERALSYRAVFADIVQQRKVPYILHTCRYVYLSILRHPHASRLHGRDLSDGTASMRRSLR
jgi:hypothetical protein